MILTEHTTLTGIPLDQHLFNTLAVLYHPDAYTEVGGANYLTDINNGYVTRRLFEVFGPRGIGWNLECKSEDILVSRNDGGSGTRVLVKHAVFQYAYMTPEGEKRWGSIDTAGASENRDAGYAVTGAMTSAIKKAISYLGHQNTLYMGMFDHSTVRGIIAEQGREFGMMGMVGVMPLLSNGGEEDGE